MSFWDDADLAVGGDYLALAVQGDTISGTITNMRKREFPGKDGKPPQRVPELFLTIDAGTVIGGVQVAPGDYTYTAGAYEVAKELNVWRPEVGDHLTVVRGALEQIKGGRFVGHYQVTVQRGNVQQAAPQQFSTVQGGFQPPTQYAPAPQPPQQYAPQQPVFTQPAVPVAPAQPGPFQQPQAAQPPF